MKSPEQNEPMPSDPPAKRIGRRKSSGKRFRFKKRELPEMPSWLKGVILFLCFAVFPFGMIVFYGLAVRFLWRRVFGGWIVDSWENHAVLTFLAGVIIFGVLLFPPYTLAASAILLALDVMGMVFGV